MKRLVVVAAGMAALMLSIFTASASADPTFGVSLSVAPNPVTQGASVVFTADVTKNNEHANAPDATVTVHAYGTDSACQTEAGYGPFSTTQVSDSDSYVTDSLPATAAPGTYYYKAEAVISWNQGNDTGTETVWSDCTRLVIQAATPADEYNLTLLANGQTNLHVNAGDEVTYTGVLSDNGDPVAGQAITLTVWSGYFCDAGTGTVVGSVPADGVTAADGSYSKYGGAAGDGLQYSIQAFAFGGEVASNCVNLAEGSAVLPLIVAPLVHNSSVFLCYSAFQTDPGVWPASEAAKLMAAGYWSPYAVKGNVSGGTNVGGYHLVCNLASGQAAGQQFASGDGFVPGTDVFSALTGTPGWYPVVP